jgi:hypothetical protein
VTSQLLSLRFFKETAFVVYRPVPRGEIAETLAYLRDLFREVKPSNEQEARAHERREIVTKNLLSNLSRLKDHPTLHAVLEVAEIFSLTLDGAHRIFGYNLEGIQEYDFRLNGGRTHIIESYPFERDLLIDLPLRLARSEVFGWNSTLRDLVSEWQTEVPIRTLEDEGWQRPGAFYVHVGTEDSLGSNLPPGAIALVEPVSDEDRVRPNPRAIYLLQFGNGYRCSRCVVTGNKLLLLIYGRNYTGPQEFSYPGGVRIAGKIRMFALNLPAPEYSLLRSLPSSPSNGPLILPWEHASMDRLFLAKYQRFRRSRQDLPRVREALETIFHSRLSGRTERRYRSPTPSHPHVDALIQLTLANVARYSDSIRARRPVPSDRGRFSLGALLNVRHLHDLAGAFRRVELPVPSDRWTAFRKEYVEWPTLLSLRFPQLRSWDDRVVRLPKGTAIHGVEPAISPGTILLLGAIAGTPDTRSDSKKSGWSRPIYTLRRGAEIVCGHLEQDGDQYALLSNTQGSALPVRFGRDDLHQLSQVCGVAVPV